MGGRGPVSRAADRAFWLLPGPACSWMGAATKRDASAEKPVQTHSHERHLQRGL